MTQSSFGLRGFIPHRTDLGRWTITFLAYLIAAKAGQIVYASLGTTPAFIWPATGVALAATFLWSNRMLTAVAAAAFVATASFGSPLSIVIGATIGNTLQALAGAVLFRFFDFRPSIDRLRDTLLLLATALTITTISPSSTYIARAVFGPALVNPAEVWRMVWMGGILSVLIVTPLITGYLQERRIKSERMVEHAIAMFSVAIVVYMIFWTGTGALFGVPLIYVLLFPFFWIAIRFSPRSTSMALFIASAVAVSGAIAHPSPSVPLGQWLFQTEMLLEIFAGIFLIVSSAIEDRRTATAELRAHVDQLENAVTEISEQDSAKSDFLAILAHELRNPLAPVLSTLEFLRVRRKPDDEETALIAGAEQRLHMMGRLLDDLLDMSRVSEKRLKLKKEYVSLRTLTERSVESAKPHIEKFNHTLDVSLPDASITLYADPLRVEQILVNVLNNAAKYTPPGGKIELKADMHNSKAIVTVRDNGTGIEAKMLERIFEPFLQVSDTKYGTSGVGVGLALAKELVQMHDGTISALSAGLGRGSTFVIEFPTVQAPTQVPEPAPSHPVAERTTGVLSVLIVDDNQAGCEALGRLLSYRGHTTTLAFTGQSGIDNALEQQPDVILLDIGLPDIEGYDVARRLRTAGVTSFIIALTGYGQDEDRRKALDAGCDGHLTKPVGLHDIETALKARFGA